MVPDTSLAGDQATFLAVTNPSDSSLPNCSSNTASPGRRSALRAAMPPRLRSLARTDLGFSPASTCSSFWIAIKRVISTRSQASFENSLGQCSVLIFYRLVYEFCTRIPPLVRDVCDTHYTKSLTYALSSGPWRITATSRI